ncbi:class II aldolase/adducin family protein [Bradyrhizobium genosp. P]|uniref:class II aldolase/adducin family protein n=1 Tax=Bradyrhizobium genosp. P TaxID=83641 RepID=UPI003CF9ABD6
MDIIDSESVRETDGHVLAIDAPRRQYRPYDISNRRQILWGAFALGVYGLSRRSLAEDTTATTIADLVASNHILFSHGVLDNYGHVSARSPVRADCFLLSRSLAPNSVTTKDILEFDLDGRVVDDAGRRLYLERFIHSAIYRTRPDVMAIVHSHSASSIAFSISSIPLRAVTHFGAFIGDHVPVFEADSDGTNPTLLIANEAIGMQLAATLGQNQMILIRGHGDVIVGPSVGIVTTRALNAAKNGEVLLDSYRLGREIKSLTTDEDRALMKMEAVDLEQREWTALKLKEAATRQ